MNRFYILIVFTILVSTIQAQEFHFTKTLEVERHLQTRHYSYETLVGLGGLFTEINTQTGKVQNGVNSAFSKLPRQIRPDDINLDVVSNTITKRRTKYIERHMLYRGYHLYSDGIDISGRYGIGTSNATFITAGVNVSAYLSPGILNHLFTDFEPIELGTFTTFKWYDAIAVGYSIDATYESIYYNKSVDHSIDIKANLLLQNDKKTNDRFMSLYLTKSLYIGSKAFNGWRLGLAVSLQKN